MWTVEGMTLRDSLCAAAWLAAFVPVGLGLAASPAQASTRQPLGIVQDVIDCKSGKWSLRCTVQTSTHSWQTDLRGWPGAIVQRGDQLEIRTDVSESRRDTWLCRNGTCRAQSVCWRWMPCWNE